jgi:tetratricopeptide (TPR) repeat protein
MQAKLIEQIEKNFEKPLTAFAGILLILFALIPIDTFLDDIISKAWIRYICYVPLILTWIIYWFIRRFWLPTNIKNRVGLVIAINIENDKQKARLKNDFLKRLNELIDRHNLTHIVNVIFLNEKQAIRVGNALNKVRKHFKTKSIAPNLPDTDDISIIDYNKIQKRIKGHFYVWGEIKERKDEEHKYFLNLDGLVIHDTLYKNHQTNLMNEFKNIWARSIEFQEKVEFKGFLISADMIFQAVEYIVGLAALYSGNAFIAVNLHTQVEKSLSELKEKSPNIEKVEKTLKSLIPQELYLIARVYYLMNNLSQAEKYIDLIFKREPDNYSGLLLKSIIEFSIYQAPKKSLETTCKARKHAKNDGTWRYNEAFLLINLGKYEEALKIYRKICERTFINEPVVLNDVLNFNIGLIKSNPDYSESHFILGYLFYKKMNNIPQAYLHFENFKKAKRSKELIFLDKHVDSYLVELKQWMSLE